MTNHSLCEEVNQCPEEEEGRRQRTFHSHSARQTSQIGFHLGRCLPSQAIVCFFGPLAAGKTTLIKGLVRGAIHYDVSLVHSPTFNYLNIYKGKMGELYHFDLYRLGHAEEFLALGFEEFLEHPGLKCIEWAERVAPLLPSDVITITLQHVAAQCRDITISYPTQEQMAGVDLIQHNFKSR